MGAYYIQGTNSNLYGNKTFHLIVGAQSKCPGKCRPVPCGQLDPASTVAEQKEKFSVGILVPRILV